MLNQLAILGDMAPQDFDIINDKDKHEGCWCGITFIGAVFPPNHEDNIVDGIGKDLSAFNDMIPDGYMLYGNFTQIRLLDGMVIAHRRRQS